MSKTKLRPQIPALRGPPIPKATECCAVTPWGTQACMSWGTLHGRAHDKEPTRSQLTSPSWSPAGGRGWLPSCSCAPTLPPGAGSHLCPGCKLLLSPRHSVCSATSIQPHVHHDNPCSFLRSFLFMQIHGRVIQSPKQQPQCTRYQEHAGRTHWVFCLTCLSPSVPWAFTSMAMSAPESTLSCADLVWKGKS